MSATRFRQSSVIRRSLVGLSVLLGLAAAQIESVPSPLPAPLKAAAKLMAVKAPAPVMALVASPDGGLALVTPQGAYLQGQSGWAALNESKTGTRQLLVWRDGQWLIGSLAKGVTDFSGGQGTASVFRGNFLFKAPASVFRDNFVPSVVAGLNGEFYAAAGGALGLLKLDAEAWEPAALTDKGSPAAIVAVTASAEGTLYALGSDGSLWRLVGKGQKGEGWSLAAFRPPFNPPSSGGLWSLAAAADGVYAGAGNGVYRWNAARNEWQLLIATAQPAQALAVQQAHLLIGTETGLSSLVLR
ncbi:hypothetical protein ACFFLM_18070 [Deinococcus oregonensis]|uniref:Uncharacterized protein n=1 Tax=Deinococcus oregonensis TaxID=1805970 RepID=A0ABV6B293_9DEIO